MRRERESTCALGRVRIHVQNDSQPSILALHVRITLADANAFGHEGSEGVGDC